MKLKFVFKNYICLLINVYFNQRKNKTVLNNTCLHKIKNKLMWFMQLTSSFHTSIKFYMSEKEIDKFTQFSWFYYIWNDILVCNMHRLFLLVWYSKGFMTKHTSNPNELYKISTKLWKYEVQKWHSHTKLYNWNLSSSKDLNKVHIQVSIHLSMYTFSENK